MKDWFNKLNKTEQRLLGFAVGIFAFISLTFMLSKCAEAHDYLHPTIQETTINQTIVQEVHRGEALAMSMGSLNYNLASGTLQYSVSGASYDGSGAVSVGLGQRLRQTFVSGSIGREAGHTGYSVSVSGKF